MKKKFIVSISENKKIRLDHFLTKITELSKTKIQELIQRGQILVNEIFILKKGYWLVNNDQIEIKDEKEIVNDNNPIISRELMKKNLNIIYEDLDLIVLNKPSGVLTHPTSFQENDTLSNLVEEYLRSQNLDGNLIRSGIAHRLDKETSGLLLVAKNEKSLKLILQDFANQKVIKKYYAIIQGYLPKKNVVINLPIGRAKNGTLKMVINPKQNAKLAKTEVKEILRLNNHSLVECILHTGRTHQIRLHLSSIKCPVLNDYLYGTKNANDNFGQYLHAYFLAFNHPIKKQWLEFKIDNPNQFEQKVNELKN